MTDSPHPAETPLISNPQEEKLEDCLALCMSGGGYRAMLFHLGVLWYLNDASYLPRLGRISSVSGGSITAGVLALNWTKLNAPAAFETNVVAAVRKMAGTTIDVNSILGGIFGRGSVSDRIINRYRDILVPGPQQPGSAAAGGKGAGRDAYASGRDAGRSAGAPHQLRLWHG